MPEHATRIEKPPLPPEAPSPIFNGPSKTARLGAALGIDLGFEETALSVSRDNRMPRASVVITTTARNVIRLSKTGEKVESIAVYGSQMDPTLHPDFREITGYLRDLRNKWFPKAKLWMQSEDPHFDIPNTRLALGVFDRVLVRFEWGTAKAFTGMTGRKGPDLTTIQTNLTHLESLVVQARFGKFEGVDNSAPAEVKAWIKRMTEIRPREIHIPAADAKSAKAKFKSAPKSRLAEIAAEATEKAGMPATIVATESVLG
ncbi:MAG: hypothetical protein ACKVXR_17235 [Planctomycetota bacterium]